MLMKVILKFFYVLFLLPNISIALPVDDNDKVKKLDDLIGTWSVVKMEPYSSLESPLKTKEILLVFKKDGVLLQIQKDKINPKLNSEIEDNYKFKNSVIIISKKNGHNNEHMVWYKDGLLYFTVPFGALILKRSKECETEQGQ